MPDVIAKVISQKGTCGAKHKVGDEYTIGPMTTPNMCSSAYCTLYPSARVLRFGGSFPWDKDPNRTTIACPDAENPVVFELKRE